MKIRFFLLGLLLIITSPVRAVITDSELDFIAEWNEAFNGPSELVADIFTPPWFFYSISEQDATGVLVNSGGFAGKIIFGATRLFEDAQLDFSVNPGYTLDYLACSR